MKPVQNFCVTSQVTECGAAHGLRAEQRLPRRVLASQPLRIARARKRHAGSRDLPAARPGLRGRDSAAGHGERSRAQF